MPLNRLAADVFGVVTICLVSLLILLGFCCIIYSLHFQYRIQSQDYLQLSYFNGPWIVRITLILIAIWWALVEILRLNLLKGKGRVLSNFSLERQENICKFYILSNLGFAEPSLFLTFLFLFQAALRRREARTLSHKWNKKTISYVVLLCFPIFFAQLILVLVVGAKFSDKEIYWRKIPKYFTSSSIHTTLSTNTTAICTYPLLSTIFLGLFVALLICYFLFIATRMVSLVINKGLQKRILILIFSIANFLPLRILFLGFSVLTRPGSLAFEALIFSAFLVLLFCVVIVIALLVYCPIADSLALRTYWNSERVEDSDIGLVSTNLRYDLSETVSLGRISDDASKGSSISFRTMIKEESSAEVSEELTFFPSITSLPSSPPFPGRPMTPLLEVHEFH